MEKDTFLSVQSITYFMEVVSILKKIKRNLANGKKTIQKESRDVHKAKMK